MHDAPESVGPLPRTCAPPDDGVPGHCALLPSTEGIPGPADRPRPALRGCDFSLSRAVISDILLWSVPDPHRENPAPMPGDLASGAIETDMEPSGFQDLVRRAQGGDRGAMDEVLEALRPSLEPLARRYADPMRPLGSTADLLQESCLRAWQNIESFQGATNDEETFAMFRVWVGQIVRRLGANAQRDRKAQKRKPDRPILRLDAPRPGASTATGKSLQPRAREERPSLYARTAELEERIRAALAEMSDETDAAMVRMRVFEGLKITEISEKLKLGYRQVQERLHAAIRRLGTDLGDFT